MSKVNMKRKEEIIDEKIDFRSLFKNFVKPELSEDIDESKVILEDKELTEKQKSVLIDSLSRGDKFANRLFRNSFREEKKKKDINSKMSKVKVDTEGKESVKRKNVAKKKKEEKIQEL